jgi:cold shock CspA family protein
LATFPTDFARFFFLFSRRPGSQFQRKYEVNISIVFRKNRKAAKEPDNQRDLASLRLLVFFPALYSFNPLGEYPTQCLSFGGGMKIPLQITFHDVPHSDAVEEKIREAAGGLEQFYDDIMSCRVVVEAPHRKHRKGKLYHLRIDLSVPGDEIVVNREPGDRNAHGDIYVMVRDAFVAAERQLIEYTRKKQGDVKRDTAAPHAYVDKIFPEDGYGFIRTIDDREVYFHRNSVLNDAFERLKSGMEVRFTEEEGEKGPQASTIDVVGREGKHDERTHPVSELDQQ